MRLPMFATSAPPPVDTNNLHGTVINSVVLTFSKLFVNTPVNLVANVCLSRFSRNDVLNGIAQFLGSVLLSTPSVIVNLFVCTLVIGNGGFSN